MDFDKFISLVKSKPFAGKLSAAQKSGIKRIIDEWETRVSAGRWSSDPRHLAYALATVFWETGRKMVPVREGGGEAYLRSKKYYPWVGEGLVQVTWEANARKFGAKKPGDCMSWPVALEALFRGMRDGIFTGKKLSTYFNDNTDDPVNARRIINGTDKAATIAGVHKNFLAAIEASQEDDETPLPKSRPSAADKPEPFDGEVAPEPVIPAKPSVPLPVEAQVRGDSELWHVQRRLEAMNYKTGGLDGAWGGLTGGAISGFITDRGLDLPAPTSMEMFKGIQERLKVEIAGAEGQNFMRPIAKERAEATPEQVEEKTGIPLPKKSRIGAIMSAIGAAILTAFNGILSFFKDAWNSDIVVAVKEFASDNLTLIFGGVFLVAVGLWLKSLYDDKTAAEATVKAFREGRIP